MNGSKLSKEITYSSVECPAGLFDRIICAIKLEKELKQTRKIFVIFLVCLLVSITALPFSSVFFVYEWRSSGTLYFISTGAENLNIFFTQWQDFALSIFESLPIMATLLFAVNTVLALFTIRLFLYKKGLLLKYVTYRFA